ncbi:sigma-54-dependent transcriptional regulator [Colwellia hornerae]|uniref:Sigma-54-dependent Fis family transcriptional regulator n=1 Tax=Colwellia hornerae TaxID=89402 RepID=A0A5C6QA23_9GAMM|nr:sigma-54 dependent transcriptional regulator [Colwellia hornerae]TWX59519.1 sigma-54-dependent Fis family transcriptional regulator [Colwellia hornerae]TWX62889.1 sigma-54-dependent Fis family transcriptional regulator [Colwellia hornerae]TWX65826.1 sigma-54-dependent Fis family transcriptional regulator [Colwellia hornerae]
MKNKKILIADDDLNIIASLKYMLSEENFDILAMTTPEAVLENLKRESVDLVLIDMNFQQDTTSGSEGLQLVEAIQQFDESLPIIVMTGWATIDIAVDAMRAGAKDFIQKPWNNERMLSAINTQLKLVSIDKKLNRLNQENKLLRSQSFPESTGIIAQSLAMKTLLSSLEELAQSDMSILLTGDNGTGKSMLAAYVHQRSSRADNSFVPVNMGAIPESLFESEMFGHLKGAFTDAKENRVGRFEMAEQGTLFLDELANIPMAQQAKLLRVLEDQKFEVVGSSKSLNADVRIISATNCDLAKAISEQQFRQDLFYRLNTIQLRVPSLRERIEDIEPLANHFLQSFSGKYNIVAPELSLEAIDKLQQYTWPGNIRELSHLMEKLLFTCKKTTIGGRDLLLENIHHSASELDEDSDDKLANNSSLSLDEIEKLSLINRLKHHRGNATETAKSLGLSRSGFYRRMSKYGLD